ncbi:hypothetical protein [Arthrobacter sp. JCM 19049]|uniref:hypothetical protein n=1 Tax=Arthrobacter sp. JCM 19049 TaxID=1460643 RepID=UPI0006D188E1|nr:hypothetical protein [Arthrobacter sp. JCM 19049]
MPKTTLQLTLTKDQFDDLSNALEDYRDQFAQRAGESEFDLLLGSAYWEDRAQEIQELLERILQSPSFWL